MNYLKRKNCVYSHIMKHFQKFILNIYFKNRINIACIKGSRLKKLHSSRVYIHFTMHLMISFVVRLNDPSPLMSHTSTEGENVRVEEEGLNDREFPSFDRSVYWRHGQRWPRCHFKYQSASLGITCWLHFLPQGNYRHRASHRNSPRKNFFNDRRPRNRFSNLKTPFSLRSPTILLPSSFILERGKLGAKHGIQLTSRCDFLIAGGKVQGPAIACILHRIARKSRRWGGNSSKWDENRVNNAMINTNVTRGGNKGMFTGANFSAPGF